MVATRSSGRARASKENPILRHWHEAVRMIVLPHLVKDAARAMVRGLQMRLAQHEVSFGHWGVPAHPVGYRRSDAEGTQRRGRDHHADHFQRGVRDGKARIRRASLCPRQSQEHACVSHGSRPQPENKLVPLAEEVNEISVRGLKATEINVARKVLLTIIENMARDEAETDDPALRIPSTREMGSLIAARGEE